MEKELTELSDFLKSLDDEAAITNASLLLEKLVVQYESLAFQTATMRKYNSNMELKNDLNAELIKVLDDILDGIEVHILRSVEQIQARIVKLKKEEHANDMHDHKNDERYSGGRAVII